MPHGVDCLFVLFGGELEFALFVKEFAHLVFGIRELFTPWTVKLSQGLVKFVIGC